MKKIVIILLCTFFLIPSFLVHAQIEKNQIKYGKFATAANYGTLQKKGGIYTALVTDMKFYQKYGYSNDSRFEYIIPAGFGGENLVDFVTVDPSRAYNRSVSLGGYDGIFLDSNNIGHTIARITSTEEEFILYCGNEIPFRKTYVINLPNVIPPQKPCNCPEDKTVEIDDSEEEEVFYINDRDLNGGMYNNTRIGGMTPSKLTGNLYTDYSQNQNLQLTACQMSWVKRYPDAYNLWLQSGSRNAFNTANIPNGSDRRQMRRCFMGPSFWRVATGILTLGAVGLGTYAIITSDSNESSPSGGNTGGPGHNPNGG